jgi:DNA invertase Pin-like site-specific DNA recombinase
MSHARAYLPASSIEQDATRARQQVEAFAAEHGLTIVGWYIENERAGRSYRGQSYSGCWLTPSLEMSC